MGTTHSYYAQRVQEVESLKKVTHREMIQNLKQISRNYMIYSSIHEIWKNLIEIYSMKKDFAVCYDIEKYYGTLNELGLSWTNIKD
ncbi:hypothetical protein CR513_04154, partial [Mucuna pruriens]